MHYLLSSERICGAFELVSRTVDLQSFFTVDDKGRVFGACQSCCKTKCEKRSHVSSSVAHGICVERKMAQIGKCEKKKKETTHKEKRKKKQGLQNVKRERNGL